MDPEQGSIPPIDEQMAKLYDELRSFVASHMRRNERSNHTLQPTEVVHEAYVRLNKTYESKDEPPPLRQVAAKAFYEVLIDHARRRNAKKRPSGHRQVTLSTSLLLGGGQEVDVLDLDEALTELGERRPRQREVVVLRYFGGLTFPEIAECMEISGDTAKEYWAFARAFLMRKLARGSESGDGSS